MKITSLLSHVAAVGLWLVDPATASKYKPSKSVSSVSASASVSVALLAAGGRSGRVGVPRCGAVVARGAPGSLGTAVGMPVAV
ncbi:hypothetical protein Sste5344_009775 [Sporothrix stenoceras]